MKRTINFLSTLAILFCGASLALATPPTQGQDAPVTASLIADVDQVEPGIPFRVGVHFTIPHPWHIYWKNPGDSGLPTRITFSAPEGSYIHPVTWPLPVAFTQPGDIHGYGYTGDTLFYTEVSPPSDVKTKQFDIVAKIKWLNCSTVCIPGKAEKTLSLPVGDRKPSAKRKLFDDVVTPKPAEELSSLFKIDKSASTADVAKFTVQWTDSSRPISVFPFAEGVELGRPTVTQQGKNSVVAIPIKGVSKKTDLEAVFSTENAGSSLGATLSIPIEPSQQGGKS